ncbi:MAG TPA: hypothetical protein PK095_00045 [Myxococcota bacterium]|nr:hypothetical protein [Myxococcota bacterium]
MAKTIIDAPRAASSFLVWPEDVVIIGLDTPHKRGEHRLWDERAFRGFNEGSVRNMMVNRALLVGEITIELDQDLGQLVADGRGRTLDAREANKRLRERGEEPFQLKAQVVRYKDDATSFERMIVKNAFATPATLLEKARKATEMVDGGIPVERVRLSFGVSDDTLRLWRHITELPPELYKRVERNALPATQAVKLARMSREQQEAALRVADARGEVEEGVRPKRGSSRDVAKAAGKTLPPTRRELRSLLDRDTEVVRRAERVGKAELADAFFAGLRHAYEGSRLPDFIMSEVSSGPPQAEGGDSLEAAILGVLDSKGVVACAPGRAGKKPTDSVHARLAAAGLEVDPAELSRSLRELHKAGRIDKSAKGYRLRKDGAT